MRLDTDVSEVDNILAAGKCYLHILSVKYFLYFRHWNVFLIDTVVKFAPTAPLPSGKGCCNSKLSRGNQSEASVL